MIEYNDRRPGGGLTLVTPHPYFPGNDPSKPSQGKLFRDPKPVDEHRYQRGYTPERMREVQGMRLNIRPGEPGAPFTGPGAERRVREVIARSTTPASEHVEEYNGDKGVIINTGRRMRGMGYVAAFYEHPSYSHPRGAISLGRTNEVDEAHNLMHELGHYRSALVVGNEHAIPETPEERGKEEAFADDNMVSRFRPDPRDVRRNRDPLGHVPRPSYEHEIVWKGAKGMGKKGFKAYNAARTTSIQKTRESRRYADDRASGFQPELNTQDYSNNPDVFNDRRR